MPFKTVLATLALVLAPAFAYAQGCSYGSEEARMSCADGMVWDAASGACISSVSS